MRGNLPADYESLHRLSRAELVAMYDKQAPSVLAGVDFFLTEIARRDQAEQTAEVVRLTRQIKVMTVVVTVFTIINVVAFVVSLVR